MTLGQRLRVALARRKCRLPLQARLMRHPLPSPGMRLAEIDTVALDLETSGLDSNRDQLFAAGWMLVRGDRLILASARELRLRNCTVNGALQGPAGYSDLDDAEDLEALVIKLLPDLAGRAIVSHDPSHVRRFLDAQLRRMGGVPLPNPFIGTMALEQRLVEAEGGQVQERLGELTLDACRVRRGLPEFPGQAAGPCAVACAELLLAQIDRLGGATKLKLRDVT